MLRKLPGALGTLLLLSLPAYADQLNVTLDMPTLDALAGGFYQPGICTNQDNSQSCVIFTGTISTDGLQDYFLDALFITMNPSNPDGGADVFDNTPEADSFGNNFFLNATSSSGLLGPDNPSTSDPDTYTGGLFEVDVEPGTPNGDYFGTATLEYTDERDCTDPTNPCTAAVDFEIMVPEPSAWLLAATGLAVLASRRRRLTAKAQ